MNPDVIYAMVPLAAITVGGLAILIPITGMTARRALKPIVEALAQYRSLRGQDEAVHLLERRFALLEDQIQTMERAVTALAEEAEFRRKLESPPQDAARLPR
jgi:hypothetical protein